MVGDQSSWYYEVAERIAEAAAKMQKDPLWVETAIVVLGAAAAFTGVVYLGGKIIEKVHLVKAVISFLNQTFQFVTQNSTTTVMDRSHEVFTQLNTQTILLFFNYNPGSCCN